MIGVLLFLLQAFLYISSVFIAIVTTFYIVGLIKFILDAINYFDKETAWFGFVIFIIFLIIAIPANIILFYIIW